MSKEAAAIKTLEHLGYTYHDGEYWKPPLGPSRDELLAKHLHTGKIETPEEEGIRMAREGVGLSNLWGDVSKKNFPDFEKVLDAYVAECRKLSIP